MHSKNIKVYDGYLTGMVVDDLLKSFLDDYQFFLRTKMKKVTLFMIVLELFAINFIKQA